ncbi:hypothetical protein HJG60_010297 [Phyllostomus discolor]|uniref:Uncharacterized protein n=1 Tax=Phyllostomus discolor TaxID=89673 RepID=A0A834AYB0_9CHIR|nr:hypothetical protein HJG60_010297 [Phyllostomus discolor]
MNDMIILHCITRFAMPSRECATIQTHRAPQPLGTDVSRKLQHRDQTLKEPCQTCFSCGAFAAARQQFLQPLPRCFLWPPQVMAQIHVWWVQTLQLKGHISSTPVTPCKNSTGVTSRLLTDDVLVISGTHSEKPKFYDSPTTFLEFNDNPTQSNAIYQSGSIFTISKFA